MKIEATGNVNENGILYVYNRKVFDSLLHNLKGKEVNIIISKKSKKRSSPQNRYYFGCVIPCIQQGLFETQGYWLTVDATHEFLKGSFNYKELVNETTGEVVKLPMSTTELSTIEFEEYLDRIRIFSDEFLNIIIDLPNEQSQLNY